MGCTACLKDDIASDALRHTFTYQGHEDESGEELSEEIE